jgi:dihydroflavonol-4-reductase
VKVLVTGATGLLGCAIARELVGRGHGVRALVRPSSDLAPLAGLSVEVARGDVLDAASVRVALAGCDAVVHAAGLPRIGADPVETRAVNVEGAEIVLGAALTEGVARAVHTSSTSVMGGTRAPALLDETTRGDAEALGIGYFASKVAAERVALALAARGLPLVVVRPSFVLGPGDTHRSSASLVVALARRRIPAYVDGGASFCDVRDVAAAHVTALERGRTGEVYVLAGHNLELGEMFARTCALAGVTPPRRLPLGIALAVAAGQEAFARVTGRRPGMTRELVRAAALYTFASSARAQRELGYEIRPFEEMVRDTLRFALATGQLRAQTAALRELAPR